jgi:hypothetical protein
VLDGGGGDVDGGEEYVETRYYDGLIGIDKQHHTVTFEFEFTCVCTLPSMPLLFLSLLLIILML